MVEDRDKKFKKFFESTKSNNIYNGVDLQAWNDDAFRQTNNFNDAADVGKNNQILLGELFAEVDLRDAPKKVWKNNWWVDKILDDSGREWRSMFSKPMNVTLHTLSLNLAPHAKDYKRLTAASGGKNMGVSSRNAQKKYYSFNDVERELNQILGSVFAESSTGFAKNDRTYADVYYNNPLRADGSVDLSKAGAIRYDTVYNFNNQFGSLRAVVPYKTNELLPNGRYKTEVAVLWDTLETIEPRQGSYVTFIPGKSSGLKRDLLNPSVTATGQEFQRVLSGSVGTEAAKGYLSLMYWLVDHVFAGDLAAHPTIFPNKAFTYPYDGYRGRLRPIGSITSSDIQIVNKDMLYVDILPRAMSPNLSHELANYLLYKAKFQPKNYVVVADNDGFINFINAERGLTGTDKGGERDTAYFPGMFIKRLPEMVKRNVDAQFIFDGKTRIADGKVYQSGLGHMYATIGLTSMGVGGNGIVGYRIFGADESSIKNLNAKDNTNKPSLSEVTPLFEIDGNDKSSGYELGYTYSDFEIFNRMVTENGQRVGQMVAVFGNGLANNSKLYFMDAYTGKKLHEIRLPGIAAMTVSAYVRSDTNGDGQKLDRVYVGDFTGSIYRVDFKGKDFTDDARTEITHVFQAPQHVGKAYQSAITAKPLLLREKNGSFGIYFGTGSANSLERDRGANSLVEHKIYGLIDNGATSTVSTMKASDWQRGITLPPLIGLNDLKKGNVKYKAGNTIDYDDKLTYDLDFNVPIDSSTNSLTNQTGWYVELTADGRASGERVIQSPQYDAVNRTVVFATWGIREESDDYKHSRVYDPCFADFAFGKVLAFNAKTGAPGRLPGGNKGHTNDALGIPSGDTMGEPSGNLVTDFSQLDKKIQENLLTLTGWEDSSHVIDENASVAYCSTSTTTGEIICNEDERIFNPGDLPLLPGRLSIQKLY